MKPPRRRWSRTAELRVLLQSASSEPGSRLVAVSLGPQGLERTLERWLVGSAVEAERWAAGHLKAQSMEPDPAVRFRWIRPGGQRAGSVVCRLGVRTQAGAATVTQGAPQARSEADVPAELAEALARAAAAERRADGAERRLAMLQAQAGTAPAAPAPSVENPVVAAQLRQALVDCARLARERDELREQLAAAKAEIAGKGEIIADAMLLVRKVHEQFE